LRSAYRLTPAGHVLECLLELRQILDLDHQVELAKRWRS